ncbi:MAG: aminoglycoside phosphotransferase family protein [Ginsengibacter sp.]
MLDEVLKNFGFDADASVESFGNGLINNTWLIIEDGKDEKFVLQRINHKVFKLPENIAFNIHLIAEYLKEYHPEYLFPAPLQSIDGKDLVKTSSGYFRVFPYVKYSHTIDVVEKPQQAYEAASQFAKFTKQLSGINVSQLKITLPDFHNLSLRYSQFLNALENGDKERIVQSKKMIEFLHEQKDIADEFEYIKSNPDFKIRVAHHDTKISNVLLDNDDKGLCVIDLDTVMPGYFISDVGDMMRTYLSPVSEEEKDFLRIEIREDFYKAIVNGYMNEMDTELTATEKKYFTYAGKFMIYMQALRFLTDFINNDIYYGSKYEGHNFVRAGNQITLLEKLLEFEKII